MSVWVPTRDVVGNTAQYQGQPVVLGEHYTLVGSPQNYDIKNLTYLMGDHTIISHCMVGTMVHVLVRISSEEDGNLLRAHFEALTHNIYVGSAQASYSISFLYRDTIRYGFSTTLGV